MSKNISVFTRWTSISVVYTSILYFFHLCA